MMDNMVLLYIGVLCLLVAVVGAQRGEPPMLLSRYLENPFYVRGTSVRQVRCDAEGVPTPKYKWTVNGTDLVNKPGQVVYDPVSGILTVGPNFYEAYNGDYQCTAYNSIGKAMSGYITIIKTVANAFDGNPSLTRLNIKASEYLKLTCDNVPRGTPAWLFRWEVERGTVLTPVEEDERRIIDQQGSLHFVWLEESDTGIYGCAVVNEIININAISIAKINLIVSPNAKDAELRPRYHADVTVKAGLNATLTCIFSYYSSDPSQKMVITWKKDNEVVGRGSSIVIPKTKREQDGKYSCSARLGKQVNDRSVQLDIIEPPVITKKIIATKIPTGMDAVFRCDAVSHHAYADPPVWLINAEPLLGCPPRFFECKRPFTNGSSQCIHESLRCNSLPECEDDSDEKNCDNGVLCLEGQKRCGDKCIADNEVCAETECKYPAFLCADKSNCFASQKRCDGRPDCPDGSDENACPNGPEIVRQKFRFNSQRTEMFIPNLTLSDTMCIQCLISNKFGTSFSDGCLTVLKKITVKQGPNSTYDVKPGYNLTIDVLAETDSLFQSAMSYGWYYFTRDDKLRGKYNDKEKDAGRPLEVDGNSGTTYSSMLPINNLGKYFRMSMKNKHLEIMFPFVDMEKQSDEEYTQAYKEYTLMKDRTYYLNISHSYEELLLNFTITGAEVVKPVPVPTVVEAASTNLWFIALILAILILFIVVALIVCYMYRNRGGTYPLDRKEHQAGHDPEQELKNNGFNDVGRIGDDDYDKPLGEEASLSESVKPYDDSDEDPIDEYGGDFDVSKFNEDGSFIGLYGDKKSRYSSEAKEATV